MINELSILIPTYNDTSFKLASDLSHQVEKLGIEYEIIVADDGSDNEEVVISNRSINDINCATYIECPVNKGRSAIRNFLANKAQYAWLLFVDGDMSIEKSDYIKEYVGLANEDVVYGGYVIDNNFKEKESNLRFKYER